MDYCGFTYTSTNVLFGSFLCMSEIVLKGQQNRTKDILYLVLVVCEVIILILCKGLRLILRSEIFNIRSPFRVPLGPLLVASWCEGGGAIWGAALGHGIGLELEAPWLWWPHWPRGGGHGYWLGGGAGAQPLVLWQEFREGSCTYQGGGYWGDIAAPGQPVKVGPGPGEEAGAPEGRQPAGGWPQLL